MLDWLLKTWEHSNLAMKALEELQADNTLAALAGGQLRVSEPKINELLAGVSLEGVRETSVRIDDGTFTVSARSERFFLARVAVPLRIDQVIFTPYRHRLLLSTAGNVSAHGTTLRQSATAYALLVLLRYILAPTAPLEAMSDPTAGFNVNGRQLEIDLHKLPEARQMLRWDYEVFGEKICPLRFVTIESIDCRTGYFAIHSSVNWDALYADLREIVYGR